MTILIDSRELRLIELLKNDNIPFKVKTLDQGDIIFLDQSDCIQLIIERKTISDLYSSIIDSRMSNQKARFIECGIDTNKIYYLIEDLNDLEKYNKELIYSSLLSILIKYNFKIIFSKNIHDSIIIIKQLYNKYIDYIIGDKTLLNLISKSKSNSNNIFLNFLSSLKGVSIDIARAIQKHYPNLGEFILKYSSLETESDKENLLIGIKINEKRKIGKSLSKNIYLQIYEK